MSLLWPQEGVLLCLMFSLVPVLVLVLGIVVVVAADAVVDLLLLLLLFHASLSLVFSMLLLPSLPSLCPASLSSLAATAAVAARLPLLLIPSCHWLCCHSCLICVDV